MTNIPVAQAYDLYSPYQYPWMAFNCFILLWITSSAICFCIQGKYKKGTKTIETFTSLDEAKKRNVVTYVVLFFGTAFAFFAQIYGGVDILFKMDDITTPDRVDWMILSIASIMVLYVWEIVYRLTIGWALLVHHVITLLLCQLITAAFFDTGEIVFLRVALLFGFHATTEQLSFVALFVYRLQVCDPKYNGFLFFAAAGQAFLLKSIVTVISLWQYSEAVQDHRGEFAGWVRFWRYAFVPFLLALYGAQIYACRILYLLGCRCRNRSKDHKLTVDEEEGGDDATNEENPTGRQSANLNSDVSMD
mmetsp:Transcript_3076/g.4148  ORF Transcript_3076/g.4148 Transcript_3076/m.4148 type:complete len:305 (-) Transcript_3076:215-1129(-)|eukprot:CAMPEP_0198137016 /NCGR_PEP_ID=MMETSP1443-20131203/563_1 /TAXON_ID=186043 /ORGANISM="Entomoneis sp., Strain CCMP2396" /LENGTH=304 /DNA_ID=CAMNT_0043798331 /DNA_START=74 /DNA_END=988 /DNA_ORIENTATION=+